MSGHFAIYLPSLAGGGAERVMVMLANGLAARGHRMDLVLVAAEGPYLSEVSSQVRIVNLQRKRVLGSLIPLARYLRREQPDAMLSALTHANLVALIARGICGSGTRMVISERNSLVSLDNHWKGIVQQALMRLLYPSADVVAAVSRAMVDELQERFPLRRVPVVSIPNPVDVERIRRLADVRPHHPWFEPGQPPVILAVGRLEAQKDYSTLLEALARVAQKREVRLVILGEGSERAKLEHYATHLGIHSRLLMPGFQSNPYGWMAASRVYVSSSRFEGFPNTLVQAMACGTPVVSTNCPTGPEEILKDGKWGRLVPIGDAEALAAAIEATLDNGPTPNPEVSLADYHPEAVIKGYLSLLNPPLSDSSSSKQA